MVWYTPPSAANPPGNDLVIMVKAPAANLPDLLVKLNNRLQNRLSNWRFEPEDSGDSHIEVIPVELTYPSTLPEPGRLAAGELAPLIVQEGLVAVEDPGLVGSPAYKPSAVSRGDFGRVPVTVLTGNPPPRRPEAALGGVRRPVVALLDTRVGEHPWLGPADTGLTGDGFWTDARMWDAKAWRPGKRLPDEPPAQGPVARELGEQEGHGTFSAGLIRQVAPDARVLAVHVMSEDGRVYGDHILNACGWLEQSADLVEGDVVCIPVGFRPVFPSDATYLGWLGDVLGRLGDRGILVVASAGNDGASGKVYPAAFAASTDYPRTRLVSVGACNPNGTTRASYSNYGDDWVSTWEVGTSVVSAFPTVNAVARADLAFADNRESADPDDFTGGYARWSGTSFAAAIHAGRCAQAWLESALGAVAPRPA